MNSHYEAWSYKRKNEKNKKDEKHVGKLIREKKKKMSSNSRL